MLLASMWFFFWAKNGGCIWRKNDWDDYKSTVLRRKGPDGKTLSNATKSTRLGGGSVVKGHKYGRSQKQSVVSDAYTDETFDEKEAIEAARKGKKSSRTGRSREADPELAEYRQEKPARVGGLNRQYDGSHFDYTNTDRSEITAPPTNKNAKKAAKEAEKRDKEERKKQAKAAAQNAKNQKKFTTAAAKAMKETKPVGQTRREKTLSQQNLINPNRASAAISVTDFAHDDDNSTVWTGTEVSENRQQQEGSHYYPSYRPHASSQPSSRQHSPRKHAQQGRRSESRTRRSEDRPRRSRPAESVMTDDSGTKSYPCHIPGVSSNASVAPGESVSQVGIGERDRRADAGRSTAGRSNGYRRGRRDSLDSD